MANKRPDAAESDLYEAIAKIMTGTAAVAAAVLGVIAVGKASVEITLWAFGATAVAGAGVVQISSRLRSPLVIAAAFIGAVGAVSPFADPVTAESLANAVAITTLAACFLAHGRPPKTFLGFATIVWMSHFGWGFLRHHIQLTTTHLVGVAIELVVLIIAVMISIQVARSLVQSRAKYRRVFDLAPVALWENDLSAVSEWMVTLRAAGVTSLTDHLQDLPEDLTRAIASIRITNANPQALQSFGLESLTDLDSPIAAVLSQAALAAFRVQLEAIWDGATSGEEVIRGSTFQGPMFDGIMRWSMVYHNGLFDPARTIVAISDIGELLRANAERLAMNERLHSFTDSSPNAMVATDESGRITVWNASAVRMFGYPESEALGMSVEQIMPGRFREVHRAAMHRAESTGTSRAVNPARLVGLRRDGSEFPLDLSLGSWTVDGRLYHSAILRDMTVQASLEGEARRRAEQLEELVRSKDQLIASVSHELRTPLTAVIGMAEILRDNRPMLAKTEVDEMTAVIVSEALDLADIVEDLLIGARTESGAIGVSCEQVDLADEAAQVVDRLWIAKNGRVRPVINGAANVAADPIRTRQIVRNLVSNATRHGGGLIHIEITPAGPATRLAVHDNGTGVPHNVVPKLFEPFAHAASPSRSPTSIGLGLSISRRLARLMGGDLTYRYSDGETVFELTLPTAIGIPQPMVTGAT